jgi:small subunit ribosomal protein S8
MTEAILEVLKKEGFIADLEKKGKDIKKHIDVELKYFEDGEPAIHDVRRLSKQSKRVYKGAKEIHPVKNSYGIMVLSTPKGILSDKEARKQSIGGEALFIIW